MKIKPTFTAGYVETKKSWRRSETTPLRRRPAMHRTKSAKTVNGGPFYVPKSRLVKARIHSPFLVDRFLGCRHHDVVEETRQTLIVQRAIF
jgi:hypothetical protein